MRKLFPGRLSTVKALSIVFLGLALICRVILLCYSAGAMSFNIWELIKAFSVGFFFDLVALSYFMLPYLIITLIIPPVIARTKIYRALVWSFFSLTIFILVFNCFAEYFFWDEFEVRYNFIAVDYLIYTTEVIGNIVESYSLPLLISGVALITAGIVWWVKKRGWIQTGLKSEESLRDRLKATLTLLVLPIFSLFFVTINWAEISDNSYNKELAKNGIYSLFEAFKNNQLDYDRFYLTVDDQQAFGTTRKAMENSSRNYLSSDFLQPVYQVTAKGEEKKLNVMFVTVESLSGEYMSYIKEPDEYETPFLDSIAEQSLFFTNMYANGTRTVRGLEALNLSIPPTPGASIVRRPDNDNLYSLGMLFKSKGYQNKFIYGGYGYFDNMNTFFAGNGYEIIDRSTLAANEITFANVWGTCDEDAFRRAVKEADKSFSEGKPFLNFIMTTSNHRPYTFPKIGIPLPDNRRGGVRYTDYALQQLFKMASSKPWYNNTIFIIVADHNGSSAGKTEIPVLKYQIPCIIFCPQMIHPEKVDKLCSQVDVAPTLAALLNWSYTTTFFGKDIISMKPEEERAFVGTYEKLGYMENNQILILAPQKKISQYSYDRYSGEMKTEAVNAALQQKIVSYYQSAEHMFMQKLNKVKN